MRKLTSFYFSAFLLFLGVNVKAQNDPSAYTTQVPGAGVTNNNDAGHRDKNADNLSPDLYTGTVNVNIPIYDYNIDGLDLGVSLSYQTLGIKVDQTASSVGLGWNLNTGGYITRQVNGVEDEATYPAVGDTNTYQSIFYHAIPELRGTWVDKSYTSAQAPDVENDPDIFTATFGGRSITFLLYYPDISLTYKNTIRTATLPKSDVHVDVLFDTVNMYSNTYIPLANDLRMPAHNINAGYNAIGFKITDEKGNQFWYGRGDFESKDYYDSFTGMIYTSFPIDRWVMQKIITYTGAEIDYHYNSYSNGYAIYRDQETRETIAYKDGSYSNHQVV